MIKKLKTILRPEFTKRSYSLADKKIIIDVELQKSMRSAQWIYLALIGLIGGLPL